MRFLMIQNASVERAAASEPGWDGHRRSERAPRESGNSRPFFRWLLGAALASGATVFASVGWLFYLHTAGSSTTAAAEPRPAVVAPAPIGARPLTATPGSSSAFVAAPDTSAPPAPSIAPRPPRAAKVPHVAVVHGQKLEDDYYWLRNRDTDPRVLDYLKAENRYADAVLQHTDSLQKKLYDEFMARTKQNDRSVPQRLDDYYYYTRWEPDRQYNIHCRRHGSLDAPEEILLDENELAAKYDFFSIGNLEVSPDHRFMAYIIDTSGSEKYTLRIKDLRTKQLLKEAIENTGETVAWANDNRTLFYTTRDDANRPYRLYRHVLETDPKQDVLVYEEPDAAFFMSIAKTRSRKFLIMELGSNTTGETRFLDASTPTGKFQLVQARMPGVEYSVRHQGDTFWIVTDDHAPNSRLMSAPVATPDRSHWQEVIPNRGDVKLDSVEAFDGYLVLSERSAGLPTLRVRDQKRKVVFPVDFPEPDYNVTLESNPEYKIQKLRFTYSSLLAPDTVYDYDLDTRARQLLKRDEVVGGYDPSRYQMERIYATAGDGARIPISLVYRKGLKRDGRSPMLLYAYGAYGLSEDPQFDIGRLSLLDRGFIYAVAHVRGGGEMGRAWYEGGKLKHKPNTFSDFIACAEHLIRQKYTSPRHLAISGASAGGLLIGAVVNARPDLFQVVVADVPFVDVLNTMLDPKLPLTVTEYEEWGNPQQPEYFNLIRSYSPYDNVRPQAYPHMLIRGSLNDSRVAYWEPAKWAARLRATKTDDHVLLLKMDLEAGHNGVSGRYDYLDSEATEYAFILDCLGITE